MRKSFSLGLMALLALASVSAFAGHPVTDLLPPDWMAAIGALGAMPFAVGEVRTITEQIGAFEAKRVQAEEQRDGIMNKSAEEGRTLDEHEREQYDELTSEMKQLDEHIARLKAHEASKVAKATRVVDTQGTGGTAVDVGRAGVISVTRNLPKGIGFARFALAMAHAKGNVMLAHELAKERYKDTPEIATILKAAISFGGTRDLSRIEKAAVTAVTGSDTAVAQYHDLQDEFIELLRPKTIIGRMNQLRQVDFMSRLTSQATGVTGSFVGEGAPKPVQKQTYGNVTLGYAKAAVIVVMSDEAVRFNTIRAQERARDDMVNGVTTYLDKRFMDPSYSGVANVSPASITNAATHIQASGSSLSAIDTDVRTALNIYATNDLDPSSAVWVMPAAVALRLSMKRNTNDERAFPELSMNGGAWYGIPVIVSNAMVTSGSTPELQIALVTQHEVLLAQEDGISIDMSQEASVQMNDAPSAGAQSLVSLWQNNLLGIRAEKFINWAPARANNLGIALIENVAY